MPLIHEMRKKLLARREELFADAARAEGDLLRLEVDVPRESVEKGTGENLVRLLDRMDGRIKAEIEAIDRALVRVETGGYGVCQGCGREIGASRLEAIPWAETCLNCAKRQESSVRAGERSP